jgi:hypothetical protein
MQIAREFPRTATMTFPIPCKIHVVHCGIHFAKRFHTQWANQTSIVMTTRESKLAEELERRLQEHALQTKKSVYRSEIKADGNIVRTPLRIHPQMIQRAQVYTGDA